MGYRLTGDRFTQEVAPRAPQHSQGQQFVVPKCRRSCSDLGLKAPSFGELLRQPTHPHFHPLWWQLKSDMEGSTFYPARLNKVTRPSLSVIMVYPLPGYD
jgi:hypothetical protein